MEPGKPPFQRRSLKLGRGGGGRGGECPGLDSTAPYVSSADIVRPRVLRPPVPHALGARADSHPAAASVRLLLVRGGDWGAVGLGKRPGVLEAMGGGRLHDLSPPSSAVRLCPTSSECTPVSPR